MNLFVTALRELLTTLKLCLAQKFSVLDLKTVLRSEALLAGCGGSARA